MASTALPLAEEQPQGADVTLRMPVIAPEIAVRAIDWPCCAAPSILHAWNALAQCAVEPNPFFESWYLLPSLRALDSEERVRILMLEADGDLAGLMPLVHDKRYYGWRIPHMASWIHPNCFVGAPLVAAGFEHAFWRALFAWADREPGKGYFLHLGGIPLEGPLYDALIAVLAEQKRTHGLVHREERAMLAAAETPETYFTASLSSKKRKELRRQFNRLAEQGTIAFRRDTNETGVEDWASAFLALEEAGWKGKAGTALAQRRDTSRMFREALKGGAQAGRLERLTLTLDERPIAMLANFITPPGSFSYKTTFDEGFSRFSPGVLLQCENLLLLDRKDIAWTDSCAAEGHPMIDHIWRERRAVGRLSIAVGGAMRRSVFSAMVKAELRRNPAGLKP